MKKIKTFIVVITVLFFVCQIGIFVYGCFSMNLYSSSVEKGYFDEILINYNDSVSYEGYRLTNWTNEEIDAKKGNIAIANIKNAECEKAGFLKSAIVNYLQTSNNSVAKIKNTMINDKEFGYPISKDVLQLHSNAALGCELIEIGTQYYIIVTYVDYVGEIINLPSSVYNIELNEKQVEQMKELKGNNELYNRNFPEALTHYYATPKLIVVSFSFLIFVAGVLTFIIETIKTKQKRQSVSETIRA